MDERPLVRKSQFTIQLKPVHTEVLYRHALLRQLPPKAMLSAIIRAVLGEDLVDAVMDDRKQA